MASPTPPAGAVPALDIFSVQRHPTFQLHNVGVVTNLLPHLGPRPPACLLL